MYWDGEALIFDIAVATHSVGLHFRYIIQKYAAELVVAKKQKDKAKLFDDFVAAEQISVLGLSFEDHTMETLKWQHDGFPSTAAYAFSFVSEWVSYTSELFAWVGFFGRYIIGRYRAQMLSAENERKASIVKEIEERRFLSVLEKEKKRVLALSPVGHTFETMLWEKMGFAADHASLLSVERGAGKKGQVYFYVLCVREGTLL